MDLVERTEPETDQAMGVAGGCGCISRVVGGDVERQSPPTRDIAGQGAG